MNPVLLKPESDERAQIIVQGRVFRPAEAAAYQGLKATLLPAVLESFARLRRDADLVLVEGAGSPAEMNLRQGDIANMGFAEAADVPVILIGDIDRGGVIASMVGTWELLPPAERQRIAGTIINKFRGDVRLFDGGRRMIASVPGLSSTAGKTAPCRKTVKCSAGLFAADDFRRCFLKRLGARESGGESYETRVDQVLDSWADHLEADLNVKRLLDFARIPA